MKNVKYLPNYDQDKEVQLSTIIAGDCFLLKINDNHCVYQKCKLGNTPLVLQSQRNKTILIQNLVTGRIVNKHPEQVVVPAIVKIGVRV